MKSLMSIAVVAACLLLGINRNGAIEAAERWPSIVSEEPSARPCGSGGIVELDGT